MISIELLSLDELRKMQESVAAEYKEKMKATNHEIANRLNTMAQNLFRMKGKDHGAITFNHDDVKVKGSIPQSVIWDQNALKSLASSMPWSEASHVFDIKFSVKESTYKALIPGDLQKALEQARTIKYGKLTLKLKEIKGE